MTTERLYYTDPYLLRFSAVVSAKDSPTQVVLDQSAFYPTSGGQPHDIGFLGDIAVLSVEEREDGRIIHHLAEPLSAGPGDAVEGRIDSARRFDHMQQHTGQHLLSAVLMDLFGFETVSFHMGAEVSTIELATPSLSPDQIAAAGERTNLEVARNIPVTIAFEDASAVSGLRKASARTGLLRVVSIEGLDRSACGGTHVRSTGEIGFIQIRGSEKLRGNTRIEFVCGLRAARRAQADYRLLTAVAGQLSCSIDAAPAVVNSLAERLADAEKSRRRISQELAQYRGRELYAQAQPLASGLRAHVATAEPITEDVRAEAQAFCSGSEPSACLAVSRTKPALLLATSANSGLHAGNVLKNVLQQFGGKGGGSAQVAQGSLPDVASLDAAVAAIQDLLKSSQNPA